MRRGQAPNAQGPVPMRLTGVFGVRSAAADGVVSRTPEARLMQDNRAMPTSVLIVDDHPSFRLSARRMLEADGYAVVGEAEDGAAAIAAARELDPDLVLLDVQLPDLDGFEVAARLRAAGARAGDRPHLDPRELRLRRRDRRRAPPAASSPRAS